jgi:hypothetical protein
LHAYAGHKRDNRLTPGKGRQPGLGMAESAWRCQPWSRPGPRTGRAVVVILPPRDHGAQEDVIVPGEGLIPSIRKHRNEKTPHQDGQQDQS